VPPVWATTDDFDTVIVPAQEAFHADTRPVSAHSIGGSRLSVTAMMSLYEVHR